MPIYTYPQLKGRIKVGDTVREDGELKKVASVDDETFWTDDDTFGYFDDSEGSLELLEEPKTLDTVDVGDVVFNSKGEAYVILDTSKNGTILFLGHANESGLNSFTATRTYLKKACFTVKQGPQPVIMTCEEAERELSKDGKQVKIV